MIERRHAHAVAANDETIFVLGGRKHLGGSISYLSTSEYHVLNGRMQFTIQFNDIYVFFISSHVILFLPVTFQVERASKNE